MNIADLQPTESRLLLNPYDLSGRDLIISAIKELLFFNLLKLNKCEIEGNPYQLVEIGIEPEQSKIKDYHRLILNCVKEHYRFYPKPINKESLLPPDRVLRDVYGKLNFRYFNFKKNQIMCNLEIKGVFRRAFPFYYFRSVLTEKGKMLKWRLSYLVKELENHYTYYKENDPKRIKKIVTELGPNILLAFNVQKIARELKIWNNQGFSDPNPFIHLIFFTTEPFGDFEFPDFDLSSFNSPGFELPDSGVDLPIFGD